MSRITISEIDNTTNTLDENITDIAYVCGFGDASAANPAKVNVPTLITSLAQFRSQFGNSPMSFTQDYTYTPDHWEQESYDSIDNVMFETDSFDPGYIYASELVKLGMPIYYEKINETNDKIDASMMYAQFVGGETVNEGPGNASVAVDGHTADYSISYSEELAALAPNPETDPITITASTLLPALYLFSKSAEAFTFTYNNATGKWRLSYGPDSNKKVIDIETESDYGFSVTDGVVLGSGNYYFIIQSYVTRTVDSIFEKLKDRGTYRIKYLTSGGYPTYEYGNNLNPEDRDAGQHNVVVGKMIEVGASVVSEESTYMTGRGDCEILIDHTNFSSRELTGDNSVFTRVNEGGKSALVGFADDLTFCAMFTPWCEYYIGSINGITTCVLPASFAYLKCLTKSVKTFASWYAIAGVARGTVAGIKSVLTDEILTGTIANKYQIDVSGATGISINAITQVQPYGYVIWGNRTMQMATVADGVTATGFLNIRNMICDIRKRSYRAAKRLMFEQNSDILWINFRSMIEPLLQQMKTGYGLKNYSIVKDLERSTKTSLYVKITLIPIYAVEAFDITITLEDDELMVSEG